MPRGRVRENGIKGDTSMDKVCFVCVGVGVGVGG